MTEAEIFRSWSRPLLLVSVRNCGEATAALAGGADLIDVKEPTRGPLGAADTERIEQVVRIVGGRVPVTVALGELCDYIARPSCSGSFRVGAPPTRPRWSGYVGEPGGVSLWKMGLSDCAGLSDWQRLWHVAIEKIGRDKRAAAVVYADWLAARAPAPDEVLAAAVEVGSPVVLVDTWDKSAASLLDLWSPDSIIDLVGRVHASGRMIALAGSLSLRDVHVVAALGADVIAVRGAACDGGRGGVVSKERVAELGAALKSGRPPVATASSSSFPHF